LRKSKTQRLPDKQEALVKLNADLFSKAAGMIQHAFKLANSKKHPKFKTTPR